MNGKALRYVDKLIGLPMVGIFAIVKMLAKKKSTESKVTNNKPNILAIKLWALGESILALTAIVEIKKKNPKAKITVLCSSQNRAIFENNTIVDRVITIKPSNILDYLLALEKLKHLNFDVALDFEPYPNFSAVLGYVAAPLSIGFEGKTQYRAVLYTNKVQYNENIHAVKNFVNLAKVIYNDIKNPKKLAALKINESDRKFAKNTMKQEKKPIIAIHPGSAGSSLSRRWKPENFANVADILSEKTKGTVVLVGNKKEKHLCDFIASLMKTKPVNLAGKITLTQLFAFIKEANMLICNDSGPMHIAASLQTPTVAIFGPNSPQRFGPYGNRSVCFYKLPNREPCIRPFQARFPECKKSCLCYKSMMMIRPGEVANAALKLIKR